MLDFDLEVEWWYAFEGDWDNLFTLSLSGAVAVGLSRLVEASARARVNNLSYCDGRKMLL